MYRDGTLQTVPVHGCYTIFYLEEQPDPQNLTDIINMMDY